MQSLFYLSLALLIAAIAHANEQYEGETTYVDNFGVTRTNDPLWYCGSVDAFGSFTMDAPGTEPNRGESCRRVCRNNADCKNGMFCYTPLEGAWLKTHFITGSFCMCDSSKIDTAAGCAPGQSCLRHATIANPANVFLDQRCVCNPTSDNSCGVGFLGVCQEVKYGYRFWNMISNTRVEGGVCKKKCSVVDEIDSVTGKRCLTLSNIRTSPTQNAQNSDSFKRNVWSCDYALQRGCAPNQNCFIRITPGWTVSNSPIFDTVCRNVLKDTTVCPVAIGGIPTEVPSSSHFNWYNPGDYFYKWQIARFTDASHIFVRYDDELPATCEYQVSDGTDKFIMTRGTAAQFDLCRLQRCSNLGSCLCTSTLKSSPQPNQFFHTINNLIVGGGVDAGFLLGEKCPSRFQTDALTPRQQVCGCDSQTLNHRRQFGQLSALSAANPGCAIPSYDYAYCSGRGRRVYDVELNNVAAGTCQCDVTRTGPSCTLDCNSELCFGRGTCRKAVSTDPYSANQCTCQSGFTEPRCQFATKDKIQAFSCNSNGIWIDQVGNTAGRCVCNTAKTSPRSCNTGMYLPNDALHAGELNLNTQPNCCTLDCAATLCSSHGHCVKLNDVQTNENICACDAGWSGSDCNTPVGPTGLVCNGNGVAVNGVCICQDGAELVGTICIRRCPLFNQVSPDCRVATAFYPRGECNNNQVCGGPVRGVCVAAVAPNPDRVCQCKNGFAGVSCEQVKCPVAINGSPCNGGFCDHSTGSCICRTGWVGFACDIAQQTCASGQARAGDVPSEVRLPASYTFGSRMRYVM